MLCEQAADYMLFDRKLPWKQANYQMANKQ
jgi:hypothetical protein